MHDHTSLLFGLESFRVVDVVRVADRVVQVVVEAVDQQGICPECGTVSSRVKERPLVRIRDLPVADQQVALWWSKRRLLCQQEACPRASFTQVSPEIPPRSRLTARLRQRLAEAIARSNRAVSEVAAEYGVSWRTAHRALVAAAAGWLGSPAPTRVLGIDETRARTVRWILQDVGWRRSDPWMTSFVDADTTGPGLLLGLAPGRSGACVRTWLGEQTTQFRAGIELVVIDPSAPYASGIRAALPKARIAVDHWHLVRLANDMLTEVRQRVTRQLHQRRGLASDPVWAHRRMLLTAGDRLSRRQLERLNRVLDADDPTGEIGAAWACKELLRQLLAQHERDRIRAALWRFYTACAQANMRETTRLALTIETWWPAILVALTERVTNARTEGFNRIIKQVKRVACGFRNMDNYRRRITAHIAVTAGDNPERLRSEASLAHLCGVAPIPASSGRKDRHRLNRGGDRAANNALYTIALCRMRYDARTREYVDRRTKQGLGKKEIMRCLKRYIVREVHAALLADFKITSRPERS